MTPLVPRPEWRPTRRWEARVYWLDQQIVGREWWYGGRLRAAPPSRLRRVIETHYCAAHGSPIYPDLGCGRCGQRAFPHGAVEG